MKTNSTTQKDRLKQIFESSIENGNSYSGSLDNLDYYSLLCKATSTDKLFKMLSCNLTLFNYKFENTDSVLIVFSIPLSLNPETQKENKHISERIMDVLRLIEETFATVDYMNLKTVKEDKFMYLTVVKKLKEEE